MGPDTLVVITRSGNPRDYTPLIIGLSAPILVAIVTGINIYVQRRIADKAVETQQRLSADAIAVQRDTAAQTVSTQLEIARKQNVVESRQEWGKELRETVADFRSMATLLSLRARQEEDHTLKVSDPTTASIADLLRLQGLIRLYLDLRKESHNQIYKTVQAASVWATSRKEVEAAIAAKPPNDKYKEARKYKNLGDALATLDNQVSELLEANWGKIKEGR
jgi:hypothetical protein